MAPLPSLLNFALVFNRSVDLLPRSLSTDLLPRALSALLLEAPQWAQELPLGLGQAFGGREVTQQLAAHQFPSAPFPKALLTKFNVLESEPVESAVFWTIFRASERKSGKMVALKVLKKFPEPDWVTGEDVNTYGGLIKYLSAECRSAQLVDVNSEEDEEGGKALADCLDDGTKDSAPSTPVYIAMEWGGQPFMAFWEARVPPQVKTSAMITRQKLQLRKIAQQMMMGLRCMSNPESSVQYVHHNINPESIFVMKDGLVDVKVKISNYGDVLASTNPEAETGSNNWYRPPEFAGLKPLVGYSPPVHSYDSFSAAVTLMTMLTSTSRSTALPEFYFAAFLSNMIKNAELYMPTRIASCIREKTESKDDFQTFIDAWEKCVTKVEEHSNFAAEFKEILRPWTQARSKYDRKSELIKLLTCYHIEPVEGDVTLLRAVVNEWVETSFDQVLKAMLDPDPSNRPTPEVVLKSPWFSSSLPTSSEFPGVQCPPTVVETSMKEVQAFAVSLVVAIFALMVTGFCAGLCCCCGTCGSVCGGTPSARWTSLVIGIYVFGGSVAANLWLSSGAVTLLELLGFVLGMALVVSGCMVANRSPSQEARIVHVASLICSFLFCVGLFVGLRAHAGPLLTVIGYIKDHETDLEAALEASAQLVVQLVTVMEKFIWFSFYPPVLGTIVCCFGLWRAQQHMQRDRRASQVAATPGMEMRSSA